MKFYSEKTKQLYDSEKALIAAEAEVTKKEEAEKLKQTKRAEEAKAVEAALKKANEAQKEADELLRAFVKKHGSFHATFDKDMYPMRWTDVFDLFFNM